MKFKVGDKVRVRKDLKAGNTYDHCYFSPEMGKYAGSVAEVILIDEEVDGDSYHIRFDAGNWAGDWSWAWVDEMLELAEESSGTSDEQPDVRFPAFQEDNVNHPQHYKHGEIETLDIIRMSLTPEEFQGFLKGNVLKYQLRAPFKHETPDEDYKKAKYYYDEYREVSE